MSYVHGLTLSHESAYHTLENIRISLQGKLEKQPLGVIQEKGVGVLKKTFVDDIEAIELILAHAISEGLSNAIVPIIVFAAMFLLAMEKKRCADYVLCLENGNARALSGKGDWPVLA